MRSGLIIDNFAGGGGASTRRAYRRHGLSHLPEYRVWQTMRLRCHVPTNAAFPDYGGRGITVCDAWRDSPETFIADMGQKPSPAHEIDRIDNDRGYEPGNCRWVLRTENDRNRRSNRLLTHAGETLPLVAWSERTGIAADVIVKRLDAGWTTERALTTPVRAKAAAGADTRAACSDCGKPCGRGSLRCVPCRNRMLNQRRTNLAARAATEAA